MKRRVREIYPTSAARPAGKRTSHFFAPAAQDVYQKLRDIIEHGQEVELFRHLNYMHQKGYDVDKQCYPEQQTALHLAVLSDRPGIVNAMVRAGASHLMVDENNLFPIFLAVKQQRLNSLRCLIDALGPQGYKTSNVKGQTLLHMAVFWGATKVIADLLHAYREDRDFVNAKDVKGNTPLYYINSTDDEKIVRALLDAGADPLVKNNGGVTPYFQCAINNACSSLAFLLTHVKEINYAQPGLKQRNLLHVAAYFGSTNVLKFLLNHYGHDKNFLNAKDECGITPLHTAAYSGNSNIYGLILRAGADATIANNFGLTPARIAQGKGCYVDYDSAPELMSSQTQQKLAELDNWLRAMREGYKEESSDASSPAAVSSLTV